jgi:putative transposase
VERNMHKRKRQVSDSWRMDETYIKVKGRDMFLYRAVDKFENTVDFLLGNVIRSFFITITLYMSYC